MQDGYPIVLRLRGAFCVVVGGGRTAARKIGSLLDAGAKVTVISPEVRPAVEAFAAEGRIAVLRRTYGGPEDLRGARLVFAATDREDVNARVQRDAEALGLPVCDTGHPERSTFHLPAVARRGKLVMAVSTSGASPAMARKIRDELLAAYGPEYDEALAFLAELRRLALENLADAAEREALLRELANRDFPGLARAGKLGEYRSRVLAALPAARDIRRWRRILDGAGGRPSSGEMETWT